MIDTSYMGDSTYDRIRYMTDKLNYWTKKYDEGNPEVSDKEWDDMYFTLLAFETTMDFAYEDSPTRRVNYEVVNQLNKVEHNHKILSLEKTKSLDDVIAFSNNQRMAAMTKVDGLTCSLRYIDGRLVSAETRGDGITGEDVLHNALVIPSIPHRIDYKDELIIDGEIICLKKDFEDFEKDYKNPRNFAAGSIRLLDAKECAKRKLTFIAWEVIKGFENSANNSFFDKLYKLPDLGFKIVPCDSVTPGRDLEEVVQIITDLSYTESIPIDGVVFKFNDIAYGKSLGETAHHFKNAIAYKFYDETYETKLRNLDWTMGRTGILTPVAVFDPIEIDGAVVERASLHNLDILQKTLFKPFIGQTISVYKANMIIPQVAWGDKSSPSDKSLILEIPTKCPICSEKLEIIRDKESGFLSCVNPNCEGKLINRLNHFCSKKGLDIKGLSSATLEKLIKWGWINNLVDIYTLDKYKIEWIIKPGFGKKSVENILSSIENSRKCDLESFLSAIGIPLVGRNVAKEIIKHFTTYEEFRKAVDEKFDFTTLYSFASEKSNAILNFDYTEADKIANNFLTIQKVEAQEKDLPLKNKKYVVTGTVKQFKNRAELQKFIEERGGKVVSSISKNVNYLINNNLTSTSAKNVAAKKMGIPIITEAEFLEELN